jgi:hypothetical protein
MFLYEWRRSAHRSDLAIFMAWFGPRGSPGQKGAGSQEKNATQIMNTKKTTVATIDRTAAILSMDIFNSLSLRFWLTCSDRAR